jgi:hypothetical protein
VVSKAGGGGGTAAAAALAPLAASIGVGGGGDLNRFLYFNAANMAVTRSHHLHADENGGGRLIRLAADLAADLRRSGGQAEAEVTAKLAASEEWVMVQVAGARTIVVLLHEKNLNLMEVGEEVARLKKASFDNICML